MESCQKVYDKILPLTYFCLHIPFIKGLILLIISKSTALRLIALPSLRQEFTTACRVSVLTVQFEVPQSKLIFPPFYSLLLQLFSSFYDQLTGSMVQGPPPFPSPLSHEPCLVCSVTSPRPVFPVLARLLQSFQMTRPQVS